MKASIDKAARKLCTHKIVFTDITEKLVAVRAMQGRSTRAIAKELNISLHEAQYRISKAQHTLGTYFRSDYRNGTGKLAADMLKATTQIGMKVVECQIAPKLIPFASQGVCRTS